MPQDPRSAILRRRALFVGSALTAAGCTPPSTEGPTASTAPVVSVAPQPTAPAPTASAVPEEPPPKEPGRPSYDSPSGISEGTQQRYDRLHKFMKESHAMLDGLVVPRCALAACEDEYRKAAGVLTDLSKDLRLFYICPGSSEEAKAFEPHKDAHSAHLRKRMEGMERRLAAASKNEDGWKKLKSEIAMSKPTPCLSFACPDW